MPIIKNQSTFPTEEQPKARSATDALAPLDELAQRSVNLVRKPLVEIPIADGLLHVPRYLFIGATGGAEPIRVGLFAGVYGDEPEGSFGLIDFAILLESKAEIARDYCLFIYPIINPTGFEANSRYTADGVNIPNEIWKNSLSPEVQALQSELWMHGFDGIISFRTDALAQELSVAVGGPIFFRHLLGTVLPSAQDVLPQIINARRDALPRWKSMLLDQPNELIRAAPGLKPQPFEIVITLPPRVPRYIVKSAVSLLLQSVLTEYRKFIAFGANI